MKKIPQDIVGDIAILKFRKRTPWLIRKLRARKFLKLHKGVGTVLEKTGKVSGRLRTPVTKHLAGERTKVAVYKENGCSFKFNVDEAYFSPRLSNERKVTADRVVKLAKKGSRILVMFAGVAPYPVVIAKKLKLRGKKVEIVSNEINRKANKYAKDNVRLNRVGDYVKIVSGDAKKLKEGKFDIILMPRPNLKETFLKSALKMSRKGTVIFYHGFGTREEVLKEIERDAGKKIGKVKIRKAGDIGKEKFRWLAEMRVL